MRCILRKLIVGVRKKKFVIVYFDIRAIFDMYTCAYEEETDNDQ